MQKRRRLDNALGACALWVSFDVFLWTCLLSCCHLWRVTGGRFFSLDKRASPQAGKPTPPQIETCPDLFSRLGSGKEGACGAGKTLAVCLIVLGVGRSRFWRESGWAGGGASSFCVMLCVFVVCVGVVSQPTNQKHV